MNRSNALIAFCAVLLCIAGCRKDPVETPEESTTDLPTDTVPQAVTVSDTEGHVYATKVIGNKRWMAENLKAGYYANGDPIPYVPLATPWSNLTAGAWSNYGSDVAYDPYYGKLYNWYTVIDPRNVCPSGWHVANEADWQDMELALGMPESEVNSPGWHGAAENVGGQLKALTLWEYPNAGANDSSGFSAYPGGARSSSGGYVDVGVKGNWWSASMYDSLSVYRHYLAFDKTGIYRIVSLKEYGSSIRCVQN